MSQIGFSVQRDTAQQRPAGQTQLAPNAPILFEPSRKVENMCLKRIVYDYLYLSHNIMKSGKIRISLNETNAGSLSRALARQLAASSTGCLVKNFSKMYI